MILPRLKRKRIGLDISGGGVKAVQIEKGKTGWRLVRCAESDFPADLLKLSYKAKNIQDPARFVETVHTAVEFLADKGSRVGLSIPNEIVKILIHKFEELPTSRAETQKMIEWWAKKSLRFPVEHAKISYNVLGQDRSGAKSLLITIGIRDVIKEYESCLKELKIDAEIISPAGVCQFNFYREKLSPTGTIAYLGLFENFFSFFVFEDAQLTFFRGIKRRFSDLFFFQDVDMIMQHYLNVNPNKAIKELYVGSQVGLHRELEEVFRNLCDMNVYIIDETEIINTDADLTVPGEKLKISAYDAAIGAALGLAL